MAAGEAVPFCKTGGLADVVGALAQALGRMGHDVRLFLPGYRAVEGGGHSLKAVPGRYQIPVGDGLVPATLSSVTWGAVTVYLVQCPKYYARDGMYLEAGKDYEDNDERFIFFARATIEGAKYIGFKPDILHCHDWQAALIPAYLRTHYRIDAYYARAASVLTLHNMAYQGLFSKDTLFLAGFGWSDFTPERLEYYGGFNFLKAGLVYADALTTVSPTYAVEIQSASEHGRGLEGVLRRRAGSLSGILNGIDTDLWNPETDSFLAGNYGMERVFEGKRANREALGRECGLAPGARGPLVGIVSRFDPQKGLDVALEILPELLRRGAQAAVLGSGQAGLQDAFSKLAREAPGAVCFRGGFDEAAAHRIYAACDLFLMPSRFEPCGLGQMIAMRYGALPVVTRTGGLADTVQEEPREGAPPNGFVAPRCRKEDVAAALGRALDLYGRRAAWKARVAQAMSEDHSWERSARLYLAAYERACAGPGP